MHEQSIRVPMIIYDPRQPESSRGKTFDEMVLNVDVTPTILQLAGVQSPERYHGLSLTVFYEEKPENWRTSIFCEHWLENNSTILKTECFRNDTWKFIRYPDHPDFVELYNLKEDENEVNNLAFELNYADDLEFYKQKCDSTINMLLSDSVGTN
jgi:arylsulfatase A-like enzyme